MPDVPKTYVGVLCFTSYYVYVIGGLTDYKGIFASQTTMRKTYIQCKRKTGNAAYLRFGANRLFFFPDKNNKSQQTTTTADVWNRQTLIGGSYAIPTLTPPQTFWPFGFVGDNT